MIKDYYRTLSRRTVTQHSDDGGSYTETTADSDIQGYLQQMSMQEILSSQQIGINAVARLFTESVLSLSDRIVDSENSVIYEVVGAYNFHHRYYDLKVVHG